MIKKDIRIEKARTLTSKDVLKYVLKYMKLDGEIYVSCAKRGSRYCSLGDSLSVEEIGIEDNDLITLVVKGDNEQEQFDQLVKLIGGTVVEVNKVETVEKERTRKPTLFQARLQPGLFFYDEQELYILMEARQLKNNYGGNDWVTTAYNPKKDSVHVFTIYLNNVEVEDVGVNKNAKYLYETLDGYVFEDTTGNTYTVNNKAISLMMNQVKKDSLVTLVFYNDKPVFVYNNQPINKTWFVVDDIEFTYSGVTMVASVMNGEVRDGMTFMALDGKSHLYSFDLTLFNHNKSDGKIKWLMYPNMNEETYYEMANKYPKEVVQKGFTFEHYHGLHATKPLKESKIEDVEKKILETGLTDDLIFKLAYSARIKNHTLIFDKYDNYFKKENNRINSEIERLPKDYIPANIRYYQTNLIVYVVAILFLLLFPGVRSFFDGSWLCFIAWIGIIIFGYFKKQIIGAIIGLVGGFLYIQAIHMVLPTDYAAYFALLAAFIYKAYLNFSEWNKAKESCGYQDRRVNAIKKDIAKLKNDANQFSKLIEEKKKQCEENQKKYFEAESKHALHLGITNTTKECKDYSHNLEVYHCVNFLYQYYSEETIKKLHYLGYGL